MVLMMALVTLSAVYGSFDGSNSADGEVCSIYGPGNVSPSGNDFLTGGVLAMYNASTELDSKFVYLQEDDVVYSAVYGYNFYDDGRFNTSATYDESFKSSWLHGMVTTDEDVTKQLYRGLSFLAMMAILGALVAWNIMSVNVLAVIGGQELLVTGLNLIFGVFFCLKQHRKQQYAWKKKTRLEKKKSRLSRRCLVRQLQVLLWISMMGNCWAMDVNVAQQITELAQAATRAAQAATTVAEKFGSKGSMSSGMESAAKVLKNPDVFNGEDAASFMGWKLNFETWMSYGDERFNELLSKIEKMDRAPSYAAYDSEQKSMSNKFFAILSSYLRGRTNALVRSVANGDKDGFKLWYDLCREYLPNSKQRTLSLAQTLAQYPQFSNKLGMLEQILNFEQLVGQYESSSGNTYPGDLKAATILRCSPQRIREYLQLSLKEDSSYADIREAILAHERVTKGFSSESILKQIQSPAPEHDTSAPMEVDRIYKGGGKEQKGKGKRGDFKGKGRGAFGGMPWGFGRGKGKGKSQKGKSKGKKGSGKKGGGKPKGKNKGNKGGASDGCWICGDTRHWSKECPNRGKVNQVSWEDQQDGYHDDWQQQPQSFGPSQQQQSSEQQQGSRVQRVQSQSRPPQQAQSSSSQQPASSSGSSTSYVGSVGSSSFGSVVRRIYDLDLPLPSNSSSSSVRMVTSFQNDFFYDWFEGTLDLDSNLHFIDESLDQSPKSDDDGEWLQVRVAQRGEAPIEDGQDTFLILDSGSDVSLLPRDYLPDESTGSGHKLRDCQGNSLGVAGTKKAEILVKDSMDEEVIFRQNFLVSNVTNAILSLGAFTERLEPSTYRWWPSDVGFS